VALKDTEFAYTALPPLGPATAATTYIAAAAAAAAATAIAAAAACCCLNSTRATSLTATAHFAASTSGPVQKINISKLRAIAYSKLVLLSHSIYPAGS
jgi:hypothetical protein